MKQRLEMRASRLALLGAASWLCLASPAWAYGRLALGPVPAGAHVLVDGGPAGTGELVLSAGRHRVQVVGGGAGLQAYAVQIVDGKLSRLAVAPGRAIASHRRHAHQVVEHPRPRPAHDSKPEAAKAHPDKAVEKAAKAQPAVQAAREPVKLAPLPSRDARPTGLGNADGLPLPAPAFALPAGGGGGVLAPAPAPEAERSQSSQALPGWWADSRTLADLGGAAALCALALGLLAYLKSRRDEGSGTWQARRAPRGPVAPRGQERASREAWAAIQAGDWDVASRTLWASLATGGSAWLYYHLGVALERLGRESEAEQAYRSALFAEPGHALSAFNLAVLLDRMGQQGQAAVAYRKLLEAHPDHADALVNLGQLYRELEMPRHAELHWRAARQLAPRDRGLARDLRRLRNASWR